MAALGLKVLGDLEVLREGASLSLPPSRKTRGLLAYLALQGGAARREQLCELLWEIPDDPRGSLRWSLSKIRKLVDDEQRQRIIADRNTVSFDASDVDIDVLKLHQITANGLDQLSDEELEQAVVAYSGGFLEGLELPNFHDFYTWCIGQREHASRSQAALLQALVGRLDDTPDRAVDYATRLVALQPYDEEPRATLIHMLLQLERRQEAEQHYRSGVQKLQEIGAPDSGLLYRAWRGGRSDGGGSAPAPAVPTPAAAGRDTSLVGREDEIGLIRGLIGELHQAEGARVVFIRGDPGMGKSKLLQSAAALAREAGAGILKASAFESELIRPFAAWNDALRRAMPDNPTSALLGSGDRVSRDQVFASLSDVLCAATGERPVVVLFDDVQWCDESSASAMHYVLRMNRRQPILVLAAARESELQQNAAVLQCLRGLRQDGLVEELRLQPMAADELERLIRNFAPGVDAARLGMECGGNPLLALELARAQEEGGGGNSLAELVQERMSRLGDEALDVLKWAALMAPRISIASLEQATGLGREQIELAVEAAEQQGILHPGERGFRFSHDLIAQSVYQLISATRQRSMHRRAAELLEVDTALDLALAADLAHHAQRSGDAALAARAMVSAGRLCLRFYANEEALGLYRRGMEFSDELDGGERVCLLIDLADIRLGAAPLEDWQGAVEDYVSLAEQALDHGAPAHARLGYQMASYVRWTHGQWSAAQRHSLQAERVTRAADADAHILGMAEAAKCLAMLERDLSRADAMAMEASALASRHNYQCPALPTARGILRYYENQLEEAIEQFEDARAICKAQGDRVNEYMANEYMAIIEIERGDFHSALTHCQALVEMGSKLREGSEGPFAQALQALCQWAVTGEDPGLADALELLRVVDAKQRLTFVLNRAAALDIAGGNAARARQRASEALELARLMERPSEMLLAHINLAAAPGTEPASEAAQQRAEIERLLAGPVANWARTRAIALLDC